MSSKGTRAYRVWDAAAEEALRAGVRKHGLGAWELIRKDPEFELLSDRSGVQLKDKWRNLVKFRHIGPEEQRTYKPKSQGPWSKKYSNSCLTRERTNGDPPDMPAPVSKPPDAPADGDVEHAATLLSLERSQTKRSAALKRKKYSGEEEEEESSDDERKARRANARAAKKRKAAEDRRFGIYDRRRYGPSGKPLGRPARKSSAGSDDGEDDETQDGDEDDYDDEEDEEEQLGTGSEPQEQEGGEEEVYVIHCPCGVMHDDGAMMIECEKCQVWAHLECLQQQTKVEPEKYDYDFDTYVCYNCQLRESGQAVGGSGQPGLHGLPQHSRRARLHRDNGFPSTSNCSDTESDDSKQKASELSSILLGLANGKIGGAGGSSERARHAAGPSKLRAGMGQGLPNGKMNGVAEVSNGAGGAARGGLSSSSSGGGVAKQGQMEPPAKLSAPKAVQHPALQRNTSQQNLQMMDAAANGHHPLLGGPMPGMPALHELLASQIGALSGLRKPGDMPGGLLPQRPPSSLARDMANQIFGESDDDEHGRPNSVLRDPLFMLTGGNSRATTPSAFIDSLLRATPDLHLRSSSPSLQQQQQATCAAASLLMQQPSGLLQAAAAGMRTNSPAAQLLQSFMPSFPLGLPGMNAALSAAATESATASSSGMAGSSSVPELGSAAGIASSQPLAPGALSLAQSMAPSLMQASLQAALPGQGGAWSTGSGPTIPAPPPLLGAAPEPPNLHPLLRAVLQQQQQQILQQQQVATSMALAAQVMPPAASGTQMLPPQALALLQSSSSAFSKPSSSSQLQQPQSATDIKDEQLGDAQNTGAKPGTGADVPTSGALDTSQPQQPAPLHPSLSAVLSGMLPPAPPLGSINLGMLPGQAAAPGTGAASTSSSVISSNNNTNASSSAAALAVKQELANALAGMPGLLDLRPTTPDPFGLFRGTTPNPEAILQSFLPAAASLETLSWLKSTTPPLMGSAADAALLQGLQGAAAAAAQQQALLLGGGVLDSLRPSSAMASVGGGSGGAGGKDDAHASFFNEEFVSQAAADTAATTIATTSTAAAAAAAGAVPGSQAPEALVTSAS